MIADSGAKPASGVSALGASKVTTPRVSAPVANPPPLATRPWTMASAREPAGARLVSDSPPAPAVTPPGSSAVALLAIRSSPDAASSTRPA